MENQFKEYALGTYKMGYKRLLQSAPPTGTFISIDWGINELVKKIRGKAMARLYPLLKTFKMVQRLKNR